MSDKYRPDQWLTRWHHPMSRQTKVEGRVVAQVDIEVWHHLRLDVRRER